MDAIHTDNAPAAAGPYSQAVKANGMMFVSGQIPVDPATGNIPEDISDQARQALTNVRSIVEAAGLGMDKVLKVTLFMTDMSSFGQVNSVYAEFFEEPYPSRSCIGVRDLPKGVKIEVDAIVLTE